LTLLLPATKKWQLHCLGMRKEIVNPSLTQVIDSSRNPRSRALAQSLRTTLEGDGMSAGIEARAKVVAERLKQLAVRLEKRAEEFAHGKVAVRAMGAV
jgi:hypothetical protein